MSHETGLELLWDAPFPDAPHPWEATDGGWAWRLLYEPDLPVPVDQWASPLAGLLTVGHRDGRQLLIDLEAIGSLAVSGDPDAVAAFLRAAVLELGGSELADSTVHTIDLTVTTAELPHVQPTTIDAASSLLRDAVAATDAALTEAAVESTFAYRAGSHPLGGMDLVVVVAKANDAAVDELLELSPPRRGVALIVVGDSPNAGAHLRLDADGTGHLGAPYGVTVQAAGLGEPVADAVADLLDAEIGNTAEDPSGELTDVFPGRNGDQPEGEPDAWSPPQARLLVRVLGQVHVSARPKLGNRELALTAYLAATGRTATYEQLRDVLWNGNAVAGKTIRNVVNLTSRGLGTFDDDPATPIVPREPGPTVRLATGVLTDHALLAAHHDRAGHVSSAEAITLLHAGLELVDGPPYTLTGYGEWAHHEQLVFDAETLIESSVLQLSELTLDVGDLTAARWAVSQGLRALPGNELLYRRRMDIEAAAGNATAVQASYDELTRVLGELDTQPSPATTEHLNRLARRPNARS
jgi:hypothetical protein